MSAEKARTLNLVPLATWVGSAAAGVDPRVMGLGPVVAVRKLLTRQELSIDDIDLAELNEAFAVQAIAVMRETRLKRKHHQRQRRRHRPRASTGLLGRAYLGPP